ncbi:hypothetical protein [Shimia sediminis]|uniref:hypothetical protein n=1 Tax=Shimia sediminis TaxID=2497945 RepID=UPI000F8D383D|nr:hypothetical protein [Shimia sediminis]
MREIRAGVHVTGRALILKPLQLRVRLLRVGNATSGKRQGNKNENGRGLHGKCSDKLIAPNLPQQARDPSKLCENP